MQEKKSQNDDFLLPSSDRADSRYTKLDRPARFTSSSNFIHLPPPLSHLLHPPVRVLLLHSGLIYLFCPSRRCSFPLRTSSCIIFSISSGDAPPELSNLSSAEVWDVRWEVRPVTLLNSSLPFTFDRGNKQNKTLLALRKHLSNCFTLFLTAKSNRQLGLQLKMLSISGADIFSVCQLIISAVNLWVWYFLTPPEDSSNRSAWRTPLTCSRSFTTGGRFCWTAPVWSEVARY